MGARAHRRGADGEGAYVWRKLLDAGARIASGSDFPVEEPNPMLGFYAAITRQARRASRPRAGRPDQRLTRDEALASFTLDAAYAAHAETRAARSSRQARRPRDPVARHHDRRAAATS